jgi:hypothetical protein
MKTMLVVEAIADPPCVIAEAYLSVGAQNQQAAWTHDPLQLAEPRVLARLVEVSEDAVAEHEVERAIRVGERRVCVINGHVGV